MAASLSSTASTLPCPSFAASTSKSLQPHKTLILSVNSPPQARNPFLSLSISPSLSLSYPLLPYNRHGSLAFRCCTASQEDPTPITNEEEQDSEEEEEEEEATLEPGDKNMWESIETLTSFYREAVLTGDFQTIAEIETAFYKLETEKNELVEKVSSLSGEITSGKERYIRLQADFDNFRKRSEKERLSVRSDAQGEVIESLLPMVDNFERAKQQLKPETEKEKQIDTSYQGIYKQFVEIMRSLRVAVVPTVGKPFDPSVLEAIAREDSEEFSEGIVIQEFQRGFLLGDKLLRPAMVKVSSGPGKKKDTAATQESAEQPAAAAVVDDC